MRLRTQGIAPVKLESSGDVVRRLGAVQAQDYLGSLWAIGLRTRKATEQEVERGIEDRSIVRTWPMRGTLHFVAAEDARWMLELMTPRVVASSSARLRKEYGLDERAFGRAREAVARALEGGRRLSREAMYRALESGGIQASGQRGLHILWRLAQDGLICFGPRAGKQQTFVLLEEWVPRARPMERDEALGKLARRYFSGHGPATLRDFAWWSGLLLAETKTGLDLARADLRQEVVEEETYWLPASMPAVRGDARRAHLLPPFDEYTVAYRDRGAVLDPEHSRRAEAGYGISRPTIVVNGRVVGTWTRTLKKDSVTLQWSPFERLGSAEREALVEAGRRYGAFLGLKPNVAGDF